MILGNITSVTTRISVHTYISWSVPRSLHCMLVRSFFSLKLSFWFLLVSRWLPYFIGAKATPSGTSLELS